MKLIDILNLIANKGCLLPKKIKFNNVIYTYLDTGYTDEYGEYLGNNISVPIDEYEILNETIEIIDGTDIRRCCECGEIMQEGYCIDGGLEYYCSDKCLHKHYTEEEWEKLYDNGNSDSYWTQWED